jgi:hypothetical protein
MVRCCYWSTRQRLKLSSSCGHKQRKRGSSVNKGSVTSSQPMPTIAWYWSTRQRLKLSTSCRQKVKIALSMTQQAAHNMILRCWYWSTRQRLKLSSSCRHKQHKKS